MSPLSNSIRGNNAIILGAKKNLLFLFLKICLEYCLYVCLVGHMGKVEGNYQEQTTLPYKNLYYSIEGPTVD